MLSPFFLYTSPYLSVYIPPYLYGYFIFNFYFYFSHVLYFFKLYFSHFYFFMFNLYFSPFLSINKKMLRIECENTNTKGKDFSLMELDYIRGKWIYRETTIKIEKEEKDDQIKMKRSNFSE